MNYITPMVYCLKIGIYAFCFIASIVLAYMLKYDFTIPTALQLVMWHNVLLLVPLKIITLIALGEFKGIFSYFRLPDLVKIVSSFLCISFTILLLNYYAPSSLFPSREIILADLLFSILFILFFRTSLRIINARYNFHKTTFKARPGTLKVAIVGANEAGSNIIAELKSKRFYGLQPVVVVDDNPRYYHRNLHDIPIIGAPELLRDFTEHNPLDGIVLMSDRLPQKRLYELTLLAKELKLKALAIPSLGEFLEGRSVASRLRALDVEDFLDRKPIRLNLEQNKLLITDKVVVVTGAGGSIGRELAKQIAIKNPKQLILIEHSEFNLFKIEQDLLREGHSCIPILLNISHTRELENVLNKYRPQLIFHAAAYKHVPLLEFQPLIALSNNSFATGELALLASKLGVEKFILISTDKAINPINNMGASKRIAEMFCMSVQHSPQNKTQFMVVRFGNVLGSAGSVLPTFKEQIARGGPVTVTHPEMTRFFMTIPEAVGLILEAASFPSIGGKTFVLDMGKPVKILDVAKKMIELNNLQVGIDIDIIFTGIRPGEKLHEDLDYTNGNFEKTSNQHIWAFKDTDASIMPLKDLQENLSRISQLTTNEESVHFIQTLIPHFKN